MGNRERLQFDDNFKFGVNLGSPHQVEGQPPSTDYSNLEQNLGTPTLEQGWWNNRTLFQQDVELAADLGVRMVRLGIEWARVMPDGKIDRQVVETYRTMVREIRETGMEPILTLYHFTLPLHEATKRGWSDRQIATRFGNFARLVAQDIAGETPYILTMNEPSVFLWNGYFKGIWPPQLRRSPRIIQAYANVVRAHNRAFAAVKEENPAALVGAAEALRGFSPNNRLSTTEAVVREFLFNKLFFLLSKNDFHGLNYFNVYSLKLAGSGQTLKTTQQELRADNGYVVAPHEFLRALERFQQTFKKPILIAENGVADAQDRLRSLYILSHLAAVHQAIRQGIPIEAYLYWSLTDNAEWLEPLGKSRFGLVEVDFENLKRTPRQSYFLYQKIARSGVIDVEELATLGQ